jgi:hypothetical protein
MPYGAKGGDTAASSRWIENCVQSVMKDGTPKLRAILICKVKWSKRKRKK